MDDEINVQRALDFSFYIVDQFVCVENILTVVDLHMNARKAPPRAVIVNDQIMYAEDLVIAADMFRKRVNKTFIGRFSEERTYRVAGDIYTRPYNEQREKRS